MKRKDPDFMITFFANDDTGQYFFSNTTPKNIPHGFVSCTVTIPCESTKRPGLEDGIIKNKEDVRLVFLSNYEEISNPNDDEE